MSKMIFAGYGGQGMLLAGQLISLAAMYESKNTTWMPSYGPEMRGGAAYCSVVVSESEIGSPVFKYADVIVAMNQPSFDKFEEAVKPGGILVYNTTMVKDVQNRTDIQYVGEAFTDIASELGNIRTANMIVLGAVNALTNLVKNESVILALKNKFGEGKANLIAVNEKAINKGAEIVGKYAAV